MRDDGPTILRPAQGTWARGPGPAANDAGADLGATRHLVAMLDAASFGNLAFAIMRASVQVAASQAAREEFDALVDLGIDLLARDGRPLHGQAISNPGGARVKPSNRNPGLTVQPTSA